MLATPRSKGRSPKRSRSGVPDSTFAYCRDLSNPRHTGFSGENKSSTESPIEERRRNQRATSGSADASRIGKAPLQQREHCAMRRVDRPEHCSHSGGKFARRLITSPTPRRPRTDHAAGARPSRGRSTLAGDRRCKNVAHTLSRPPPRRMSVNSIPTRSHHEREPHLWRRSHDRPDRDNLDTAFW